MRVHREDWVTFDAGADPDVQAEALARVGLVADESADLREVLLASDVAGFQLVAFDFSEWTLWDHDLAFCGLGVVPGLALQRARGRPRAGLASSAAGHPPRAGLLLRVPAHRGP